MFRSKMGHSEKTDRFPRYRAVLVATALIATREAPPALSALSPASHDDAWAGMTYDDGRGWRAVAVAAGAVPGS